MKKSTKSVQKSTTSHDDLLIDNAMSALRLEMNHGAIVHISDDAPPEIVNDFLQKINTFEENHKKVALISIFEFLGSPPFASPDLLDASTLPEESTRIERMLYENGLAVTHSGKVPPEEWYRFMVEDVFQLSIPNIRIPDMMKVIVYEDFYPDTPTLIKGLAEDILFDLLELEHAFSGEYLSDNLRDDTAAITREAALHTILAFRSRFTNIQPIHFRPESIRGDQDCVHFIFAVQWSGITASGGTKEDYEGLGVMQFAFEAEEWRLQGILMPGFQL
jgi:hypothetical protein